MLPPNITADKSDTNGRPESPIRPAADETILKERQSAKIAEWMKQLLLSDQLVEIRVFKPWPVSRTFDLSQAGQLEVMAAHAASLSGKCEGVCFTPNPIKPGGGTGKGDAAKDTDILERRYILIDIDALRS